MDRQTGPAAPTGGADAHDSLRKVLGYVHADIVEAACARLPLTRDAVGDDGAISDSNARKRIAAMLRVLISELSHRDTAAQRHRRP